jgi:hypothetical protein
MNEPELSEDFLDLLIALDAAGAEFVVVGAHALAAHGILRATADLDVFVKPSALNAKRVIEGLRAFGAPLAQHGVGEEDFAVAGNVYQMGLPPWRIDLLTEISGVTFEEALNGSVLVEVAGHRIAFLGREELIKNKLASGRDKDLLDVDLLKRKSRQGL